MKRVTRKESERQVAYILTHRVQVPKRIAEWGRQIALSEATATLWKKGTNIYWCGSCGQRFTPGTDEKPHTCPHCGATLTDWVNNRTARRYIDYTLLQERTTYGDWQVIKEYAAKKDCGSGHEAGVNIVLMYALFINPSTGHCHTVTRSLAMCPYWSKLPFALSSSLRIRRGRSLNNAWHCGWRDTLYPHSKLLPEFCVRGIVDDDSFYANHKIEETLWASARGGVILETLVKTGQHLLADLFITSPVYQSKIIRFWKPYLIARRHGLQFYEGHLRDYFDYLDEMRYLGRDLRNPVFCCPSDLKAAHTKSSELVMIKKDKARARAAETIRRKDEEAALREAQKDEKSKAIFRRRIKRYLGFMIITDDITIRPLQSVDEFYEEGRAMHHCVFSNRYYARPDSLILSARDKDGQRLETIEVSLRDFSVIQSRAVCNGQTPQHQQILDLMAANMSKIRQLAPTKNRNTTIIN